MAQRQRFERLRGDREVLNVAHRGARAFAPENTLPAIRKAAELGADMIEIDVHLSRDGQIVVMHDDTLDRCSNVAERFPDRGSRFVSDFDLAELKQLDAGSWFVRQLEAEPARRQQFLTTLTEQETRQWISDEDRSEFERGVQIPTLDECLDVAIDHGLSVNIELKTLPRMYDGLAAKVVELVRDRGLSSAVLISSFDHWQLVEVRRLSKEIATGVLSCDRLACVPDYLELLDADSWHPCCHGDVDSLGFGSVSGELQTREIDGVLTAGFGAIAWTSNVPAQIEALIKAGVSGVISDFPNRVRGAAVSRDSR